VRDILDHAYESEETNSFVGFDEDYGSEEEFPLGIAKEGESWVSILLFLWVTPLIKKGACGLLKSSESVFELPANLCTSTVANKFHRMGGGNHMFKSLHKCFGVEFYAIGVLKLISDVMDFFGPILLNFLVRFIEDDTEEARNQVWMGYSFVLGLFLTKFVGKWEIFEAFCFCSLSVQN